jgi:hypothetical protein
VFTTALSTGSFPIDLFLVCLTTLSVAQTLECRMIE